MKTWYRMGIVHREDGPAVEYSDGSLGWFYNNVRLCCSPGHICGDKYWYYYGKCIACSSQKEFERLISMKVFW